MLKFVLASQVYPVDKEFIPPKLKVPALVWELTFIVAVSLAVIYFLFLYLNCAANDKIQPAPTATISARVPNSVFFQLLFQYHSVTHYLHKFSGLGDVLAPAAAKGVQVPWWGQQGWFVMSPLLLTSAGELFLAVLSFRPSIVCWDSAAALKYLCVQGILHFFSWTPKVKGKDEILHSWTVEFQRKCLFHLLQPCLCLLKLQRTQQPLLAFIQNNKETRIF